MTLKEEADRVFSGLPLGLQYEVRDFLAGVLVGDVQPLERFERDLYIAYEPVRRLLRERGPTVRLFRGEPINKPGIQRTFLSWTPILSMAAKFSTRRGFEIVGADVDVEDVVAVLYSPHNPEYVEFLVRERPRYHRQTRYEVPLLGIVYLDLPLFSRASVASALRDLRSRLRSVGGKLVRIRVNEDEEHASVTVILPQSVGGQGYDFLMGPYRIEALQPYVGMIR